MTAPHQPGRLTYGGAPWALATDEGSSPHVAAEITLHRTAHGTLAGHVFGANHKWATTALELAGFSPADDGIHQLSMDDFDQTRQALHQLRQSARDLDVTVTLSPQPYLGDVAVDLAQRLPGQWEVDLAPLPEADRHEDLLAWVWSPGRLPAALEQHRIPCAARLTGDGTELLLVQPDDDNECVIGAMLPSLDLDFMDVVVDGPQSVSAASTHIAAAVIQNRLLPQYEEALFSSRLIESEDDLRWAQETYEPGEVVKPYPGELVSALNRFLHHASELIAHVRRPKAGLTAHEDAFVKKFEAHLRRAQKDGGDAMSLWLAEGERLLELASAGSTREPTAIQPPARFAAPVPPRPAAVTSTARSR